MSGSASSSASVPRHKLSCAQAFCEALQVRLCRSLNVISALVKRRLLQIADPLVAGPTVDADANNRS